MLPFYGLANIKESRMKAHYIQPVPFIEMKFIDQLPRNAFFLTNVETFYYLKTLKVTSMDKV